MSKEPTRQKWAARAALAAGAAACAAWLMNADLGHRVTTDILDLVPADPRSTELSMVRSLADQEEARVLLIAVTAPAAAPRSREAGADRAAAAAVASLASDPAIARAQALSDPKVRERVAAAVYSSRMELLLPSWLSERRREYEASGSPGRWDKWLAERAASNLEAYLSRPEAMAAQDLLTSDPLLLVPGLASRMEDLGGTGLSTGKSGEASLIWALGKKSPLSPEGQGPVSEAIARAAAAAARAQPGSVLRWTGFSRFAAASRERIEHEVGTLNLLSLALVVAVAAACVRRVYRAAHLIPVVLGSLLGAWTITTAAWGRVHILVFVIGSLLAGVAIDYGFYLYLQPRRTPDEPYRERAARLIRPLLASALTTVIGFSFLLWSELPLIRQLGVFVSAGLIFALATALLWFAQVDNSFLETRPFISRRLKGGPGARGWARAALFLGGAVALAGPWRLHWRDDIRELQIPTPAISQNDESVRSLFGQSGDRVVYLTSGTTVAQARSNLDVFLGWHARAFPDSKAASLGYALPTEAEWASFPGDLAALGGFPAAFRAALERHGFEPASFERFFESWDAAPAQAAALGYKDVVERLRGALEGPLSSLMHSAPGSCWFVTIAEQGPGPAPPPDTATVTNSQLESMNQLFSRYRVSALRLSAVGLAFVGASVFVLYGLRRGARIFAIPAGACLFAFGVFGLCGATLNLFNLLGAFLGVCLSHNYAIFTAESLRRGEEPPPSIRMSAVATASSFGVLALSRIPVVSALGSTVAVIVLAALAITELTPLASGAGKWEPARAP